MTCSEKRDHLQKMVVTNSMMRKSNIFCRKLQLVVNKHYICTDMYIYKAENSTLHYIVEYIQHIVH